MKQVDNFNPGKWLIENKLTTNSKILNDAFINDKGDLQDFDSKNSHLLSKKEWDKYKKEWDSTQLNLILFMALEGELEGMEDIEDYKEYDIDDIMINFRIPNKKAASLIYDIFQILKSDEQYWNTGDTYQSISKVKYNELVDELEQYATPKKLFDNNLDGWYGLAVDDYDTYLEWNEE
jgi:hypothetical protein